jgi:hypothetical protein
VEWRTGVSYGELIYDTIKEMIACQCKWLYLESAFSAPDIQSELKDDHKLFTSVDHFFKKTMKKARAGWSICSLSTPGFLEKFKQQCTFRKNREELKIGSIF